MGISLRKFLMTPGWLLLLAHSCKEPYIPQLTKQGSAGFLVIDGILQDARDSTIITLSRSRTLTDTVSHIPEENAQVSVESGSSEIFTLSALGNGRYGVPHLNLLEGQQYRLKIYTSAGKHYVSDFVPFKPTPAIDSLNWLRDTTGVSTYVNTHDPSGQTRFYRWEYTETWQYHTYVNTQFDLVDGMLAFRGPNDEIYNCWRNFQSKDILIGSSGKLNEDLIYQQKLAFVPTGSEKLSVYYSILAKQYALTPEAYDYWQTLKKNTEALGGIFDPLPSTLTGNIHCVEDPSAPVLGFVSASSVQQLRLFVNGDIIDAWDYIPYYLPCLITKDVTLGISPSDTKTVQEYLLAPKHLYTLWYMDRGLYIIIQNFCADCREHGGSNIKPDFWP